MQKVAKPLNTGSNPVLAFKIIHVNTFNYIKNTRYRNPWARIPPIEFT